MKKRNLLTLVITFFFFLNNICVFAQKDITSKNISILVKGVDYYEQKEFLKAETEFFKLTEAKFQSDEINDTIKFLNKFWLGRTYYELNKFKDAKLNLDSAFVLCKKVYAIQDEIYLTCLKFSIRVNMKLGNNDQLIKFLLHKRDVLIRINRDNSSEFADNDGLLGDIYGKLEDFVNSEKFYLNSIYTFKKINDIENDNYSVSLHNLGTLYSKLSNYKKASDYLSEAASILKKIRGKDNSDYCNLLINLADAYSQSEYFFKADSLYNESIELSRKLVGEYNSEYFLALNHYAAHCIATQDYQKADSIYRNTLSNIKQKLGDENSDYLTSLMGLAGIYTTNGNYKEAKKIVNQALLLSKKLYTEDNYRYAQVLFSLGRIYAFENNNYVADSIFNIVLKIYSVAFGESHTGYGIVLGNLADLNISNGELSKAEEKIRKELVIFKQNNARRLYSIALSSLGYLFMQKKEYKDAEEKLLEAKRNQVEIFGDSSLDYSFTLVFLAELSYKMGKYEDAVRFANEASQIRLKILGYNNIMYAGTLNLLSVANFGKEKYDSAILFVKKAIGIYESVQGYDNPGLVDMLLNLSKCYVYDKKFDSSISVLNRSNFLLKNHFNSKFFTITNSEQQKLIYTITPEIETIGSLCYLMHNNITSATRLCYNNELFFKGIILRNSEELSRLIKKSGDQFLIKDFESLKLLKLQIQQFKINRNLRNTFDQTKLESIAESKERLLIQTLSKNARLGEDGFNTNWIDVQKRLTKNDVAIEFINFKYRNQNDNDSILYGAFVLRPSYKEPKFVYLFEQKQFDSINIKHQNTSDSSYFNQLYQYGVNGKKLQELIWKPIDSLLEGVKTIYAAPSGLLHTINLSALPLNNSTRLGDRYNLRIVGSTGELISIKEQYINDSTVNKAWLFGGIDYNNLSITKPKFDSYNKFNYSLSSNPKTRSGTEKWNYLLNTLYEASTIDTMCRKNHINTSFINGKLASKTAFKNISGETKPYILHLATHGYFFPDIKKEQDVYSSTPLYNKQNIFKISDNPLLRSGLIFSGANKAWSNPNYQSDSTDDGILTALEVSNLDLSEAKLVVMSACETGLGDIKGSEGVFGLQRAFKLAGAKNIMMSLWKVPDAQTKELMALFYENCFNGLSVSDALRAAQKEMSKKYPPYYWAAFKLLE